MIYDECETDYELREMLLNIVKINKHNYQDCYEPPKIKNNYNDWRIYKNDML